uniref:Uncharacterized protein n=1 Tax=Arundo donax TaxID=35708 RepID=A0A0A9C5T5_ARUDO
MSNNRVSPLLLFYVLMQEKDAKPSYSCLSAETPLPQTETVFLPHFTI